jgi:signal transduction histidine kinase
MAAEGSSDRSDAIVPRASDLNRLEVAIELGALGITAPEEIAKRLNVSPGKAEDLVELGQWFGFIDEARSDLTERGRRFVGQVCRRRAIVRAVLWSRPVVRQVFGHPGWSEDRESAAHAVTEALTEGRRPRTEFRIRTKDGGYLWVESVGKELEGVGARSELVITTRDISERKAREADLVQARDTAEAARKEAERAREEAEQANRLKSAFLANMSHEIRTPLTSVIGFSEVLEEEVEADYARFARLIRQSSTRLKEVLNSVLRLSKLEVGAVEFEPEDLDLATEVERTVELLQPQAEDKDLDLRMDAPDELPAHLDPGATGRILDNLVSNAIKYTPDGGRVDVRLRSEDSWAELEVSDTGKGIDEELLPNLFEPFVQAPGEDGRDEGSGLGLAITKRLVEGMNGEIDVDTEPGEGTCFTVRLDREWKISENGTVN